jgi:hypothetical protein
VLTTQDPPLTAGATPGASNIYQGNRAGEYQLVTPGALASSGLAVPHAFADISTDRRHVLFESTQKLTDDAPLTGRKVYRTDDGVLSLASVLPDGTATAGRAGSTAGSSDFTLRTMSDDGSRVFFSAPTSAATAQVYVRQGSTTTQASASQATVPDPNGTQPAMFAGASADGSSVLLSSAEKLTDDATTGPASTGRDLYRYNVDTQQLEDLTVGDDATDGARVMAVLGVSVVGDPVSIPRCKNAEFQSLPSVQGVTGCDPSTQIGTVTVKGNPVTEADGTVPLYNMVPPVGTPAEFAFDVVGTVTRLRAKVRTEVTMASRSTSGARARRCRSC